MIYGSNIDLYRDYLMINEAYVGKTPILEQIENKIGEARKKVKYYGNNNTLKEVLEINRLFEKQFGMDVYALQIYPSNMVNAFTQVIATNFDIARYNTMHDWVEANSSMGYRFKKGNNFCVLTNIASGLITDTKYTDEEIVAILLHELGHNFADCIYDDIEVANKGMMNGYFKYMILHIILTTITTIATVGATLPVLMKDLKIIFGKQYNNEKKNKEQKKVQRKPGGGKFKGIMAGIRGKFSDIGSFVNEVFARIGGGASARRYMRFADISNVPEEMKKNLGRANEVIADKFAGIYGYGPAQASALIKLGEGESDASKFVNKIGLQKANNRFEDTMRRINDYDVHPQTIQRIMEEVKLLENELKKEDLDPKVRKVIEGEIKQIKDILDECTKTADNLSRNENAQRLYNAYILNECPDAVDQEIEDKIEKALDDALNKK